MARYTGPHECEPDEGGVFCRMCGQIVPAPSPKGREEEDIDIVKSALFTAFESGWFDNQGDLGDGWEERLPYLMDTYEVKALLNSLRTHSPEEQPSEYPPCDDCGTEVWYNAWVEDDVWEAIRPEPGPSGGGGTLCARCIDRRCVEAGLEDVTVRWHWTGEAAQCHSPEEPVAWQPIETAPKDGTWVILYAPEGGVQPAYWGPTYFGYSPAWIQYRHRSEAEEIAGEPTHWMPLPEPPIGQPLDGEGSDG